MGRNLHIVPNQGRWAVKKEGKSQPVSTHRTQELARQSGVPLAKIHKSELVIHNRKGQIIDKDSYGKDPNPPKDRKH